MGLAGTRIAGRTDVQSSSVTYVAGAGAERDRGRHQAPVPIARYDAPKGRVEVMGLKHWTLPMLREKLGFADALVATYTGFIVPEESGSGAS